MAQGQSNEGKLIPISAAFAGKAHVGSFEQYEKMYRRSVTDPEGFWGEVAEQFVWKQKWTRRVSR